MVVGNGMIATAFKSYLEQERFIVFASGVSDSSNANAAAFERETALLTATLERSGNRQLIYFSTCSVYDESLQHAAYVVHKKNMETLVSGLHDNYLIFRVSNPVGHTKNTSTLINFLIKNILEETPFFAWKNAARNIIDIDDLFTVCNDIIENKIFANEVVNIANPENYPIPFIISSIETHFKKKGNFSFIDKGDSPHIDTTSIEPFFRKHNINFEAGYLSKLLQKYFPSP